MILISSHFYQSSSNLPAPINVGSTEQTKAGNLIIGGTLRLGQFATAPSGTEGALYFNTTEKKTKVYSNSAWGDLGGGSLWTASSTNIYYNTGNVGIGTTGPSSKFTVIGAWPQAYFTNTTGASYGVVIGKNAAGSWGEIGAHHWNGSVYDTWADLILQTGGGNVGIGKTNPGTALDVAGTVTATGFYYASDESLKKNIQDIETPLAKIMKLDGISFDWKESGKKSIGLIAQDVEKVFPEIVNTDEGTGLKSIEYGKLVAPLIEAVKEQQKMIDEQKELIEKQGEEIKKLKALFE